MMVMMAFPLKVHYGGEKIWQNREMSHRILTSPITNLFLF